MAAFDVDNSGLLEKDEMSDFLAATKRDLDERVRPKLVMAEEGEQPAIDVHARRVIGQCVLDAAELYFSFVITLPL